jgi:hypothetical protein
MQTARHFRDQAALCLEIAQQLSDPRAADNLRAAAGYYQKRAAEIEQRAGHFEAGARE